MDLSIVCVTNMQPHAAPFIAHMRMVADRLGAELVLGLDGKEAQASGIDALADVCIAVNGTGILESVLDEVLDGCNGHHVLRIDDDEKVSPALMLWLATGNYRAFTLCAFPRPYLWGNETQMITDLYPDLQTRLSTKARAGGRATIHAGSPFGTGTVIPYAIEHHKFLVRSLAEREQIAARYEQEREGAGLSYEYGRFNLPERFLPDMQLRAYTDGDYSR